LGDIPFTGFKDMVLPRFSGHTDSGTHSQMDRPENRMPLTAKVFDDEGTK